MKISHASKKEIFAMGLPITVGPIGAGMTAEQAAIKAATLFGVQVTRVASVLFKKPVVGQNRQYATTIGTFWAC
jgi:hypothetical protein